MTPRGGHQAALLLAAAGGAVHAFNLAGGLRLAQRMSLGTVIALVSIVGPLLGVLYLLVGAALLAAATRWLGGQASAAMLRPVLAWSLVPVLVVAVPGMVARLALAGPAALGAEQDLLRHPARVFLGAFLGIALVAAEIWTLVLVVKGTAEAARLSIGRTIGALLLASLLVLAPVVAGGLLLAMVLAGTTVLAEGPPAPPTGSTFFQQAAWSPDSRRLVFSGGPTDGGLRSDIHLHDLGAGTTRALTATGKDGNASFGPDGRDVVFDSRRGGESAVFLMAADGSGIRRVGTEGPRKSPAISPDGKRIAHAAREGEHWRVAVMALDGSGARTLSAGPGNDLDPRWSRDGRWIAFHSDRQGAARSQVFVVPARGGPAAAVTDHPSNNFFPLFRRDGRLVFTSNRDGGTTSVYTARRDGREVTPLVPRAFFAAPSPDGRWIAALFGRWPNSRLALLDAKGTEIRQIAP
jgi:hypothetical protein